MSQAQEDMTRPSLVARITVLRGASPGESFLVERFPAIIGRGNDADIRIQDNPEDPTISRRHLRLSLGSGRIKVQDLSTNGTTIGQRMLAPEEQCLLGETEEIWLGTGTQVRIDTVRSGTVPARPPGAPTAPPPPPASGRGTLRLQALGGFSASWDEQVIPESAWETRKPMLLLTYLAWQGGRPVAPERLCNDLWPDHNQGGRQALQSTLARLRRALRGGASGDPVIFERGAYRLNPEMPLLFDVAQFQSACQRARSAPKDDAKMAELRQAQLHYRGSFLEGYSDDWACLRRQDLQQLHHQAMAELGDLMRSQGAGVEAIALYREILDLEPCWEQGHQGVVQALLDLGRRDEAVRHYHRYVETLKSQLGLSPSPEMMRLYYSLLDN